MDKILTAWHEAGCKTLAECVAHQGEQKSTAEEPKRAKKSEAPKLRYGDFDIDDAFQKALNRSYGTPTDTDGDN